MLKSEATMTFTLILVFGMSLGYTACFMSKLNTEKSLSLTQKKIQILKEQNMHIFQDKLELQSQINKLSKK